MQVYINDQGHMTKKATMAINSKHLLKNLLLQMILKFDMKHQAMELYKFYINHGLGMTLICFTTRST